MRICFICSEYPPGPHGGIGTLTQVLGRRLARAGHEVRVIGAYPAGHDGAPYAVDQGVRVWRLTHSSAPYAGLLSRWSVYRRVRAWAERGELDIVEAPDWQGPLAGWPRLRVPVVVRANGTSAFFAAEAGRKVPRSAWRIERASLERADAWCASSAYAADRTREVLSLSRAAAAVLFNPVELPPTAPAAPRARNLVVFTGTLTEKKGVVGLVRAWSEVRRAMPSAELHLYGKDAGTEDGSSMQAHLLDQLEEGVRPSVHFHGHVPRETLFDALEKATVAVFPSYAETFGIAPVESMARGCPTIYTTRRPGPEVIRDGVDGLLVDPDRPHEIARAILRLMSDRTLAARLGSSGAAAVRERFSTEALLEANLRFFEGAIEQFRMARSAGATPHPADTPGSADGVVARFVARDGRIVESPDETPPVRRPGLTVVVCTHKRPEDVRRFLDSLLTQAPRPQSVMIVDASPDDATERVVRGHPSLSLLGDEVSYARVTGPYRGLTRQRNYALERLSTSLVMFCDDDLVLLPGCLDTLQRAMAAAPEVVGVGPFIENEFVAPSRVWRWRARLRVVTSLRPGRYSRSGVTQPWSFQPPTEESVEGDWLRGCAMMWRSDAASRVRFNDAFSGYANGEDTDFSLRMRAHGRLLMVGSARAVHVRSTTGRPENLSLTMMTVRNNWSIHRRCLTDRRWTDTAWFLYAHGLLVGAQIARSAGQLLGAGRENPPHTTEAPVRG